MSVCGGLNNAKPATEEVQSLVDKVKDDIHAQAGKQYPQLKAVSYRSQVVAGTNFYVKVHAGDEHIHVKLFRPLPVHGDTPKLSAVQTGKTHEDEIEFF